MYQISSSELQRISISTSGAVFPRCSIDGKLEELNAAKPVESNHLQVVTPPIISPSVSTASTSRQSDFEDATEPGDITIDSVRDHTNSSPVPPAVSSTT